MKPGDHVRRNCGDNKGRYGTVVHGIADEDYCYVRYVGDVGSVFSLMPYLDEIGLIEELAHPEIEWPKLDQV